MAVAPGQPHTLAAVTGSSLNIYDDSVRRSLQVLRPATPFPTFDTIAWGGDAAHLSMRHPLLPRAALNHLFVSGQNGPTLTRGNQLGLWRFSQDAWIS